MSARAQAAARGYRLRPAPRKGGSSLTSRIRWDRLGRVALVIVFFAIFASYINPVVNFVDAWRDSKSERSSLTQLRAENDDLRQRIAALDGSDAAAREARKMGMILPGERAYVIRNLND
jgi:cell division protein FtsB